MSTHKKSVRLEPFGTIRTPLFSSGRTHADRGPTFRVTQVGGLTSPLPGDRLTRPEVDRLIQDGVAVTIDEKGHAKKGGHHAR